MTRTCIMQKAGPLVNTVQKPFLQRRFPNKIKHQRKPMKIFTIVFIIALDQLTDFERLFVLVRVFKQLNAANIKGLFEHIQCFSPYIGNKEEGSNEPFKACWMLVDSQVWPGFALGFEGPSMDFLSDVKP